ncbi:lipid IV(A) 3-deoxy-D-manno-octulosonic acid transferase [Pseudoalteromonas denitrificans]|nr:lipid IV(A) 3-deoxy-D-manno-octulosonic acid transferase [Pseudoalteromonas denitrificans]
MSRFLYSFLLYLLSPAILLHLWLRGKKSPDYRKRWHERFGFIANHNIKKNAIVFHCASVGEVVAATPLIKKIQHRYTQYPIVITCNTPTGTEQIKRSFDNSVEHVYLPLDFPDAIYRFLKHLKPKMVCILETELWPNLISQSNNRKIPLVVLNARLSEKSFLGYKKVAPLSKLIMNGITQLAAHDKIDAQRFVQLGLDKNKIHNTGSIKFDIQLDSKKQQESAKLKQQFSSKSPIWIAGSTHPGEDELLISAHKKLLKSHPDALLILVPRHPERFDAVAQLVKIDSLSMQKRSELNNKITSQVLLGDTMGELSSLYGAADVAFIAGSLIERGGHNPLEASAYGIPVITGPHIFNFLHVYPELLKQQGCLKISSIDELTPLLINLFSDTSFNQKVGKQGALFVEKNQGAIDKTIQIISEQLTLRHS